MIIKTQREIFNEIAISIIEILPQGEKFNYAVLEIKRFSGSIGFTGYYVDMNQNKKWLDIFNFNLDESYIEELYITTQTQYPIHTNWNRVKYTLFHEGKMEIEYIWDQDLQDEVDRLNNQDF